MKCQICDEREAIVHVQQIMGEKVIDLHLCEVCAQKKGISSHSDKIELSLTQLLTGLIDIRKSSGKEDKIENCPKCGKTLETLRKEGKLGCVSCYSHFHKEIASFLDNYAGTARHKGSLPARLLTYKALLMDKEILKKELSEAVKQEDYEQAAVIRDRIRTLEIYAEGNDD